MWAASSWYPSTWRWSAVFTSHSRWRPSSSGHSSGLWRQNRTRRYGPAAPRIIVVLCRLNVLSLAWTALGICEVFSSPSCKWIVPAPASWHSYGLLDKILIPLPLIAVLEGSVRAVVTFRQGIVSCILLSFTTLTDLLLITHIIHIHVLQSVQS
jgi:hypothetical protein